MKISKISAKDFGKAMVKSYNSILMRKNKLSRSKARRLLFVATLDRLENDGDYRTVCNSDKISDIDKAAYKAQKQHEAIQQIIEEIGGNNVFQL